MFVLRVDVEISVKICEALKHRWELGLQQRAACFWIGGDNSSNHINQDFQKSISTELFVKTLVLVFAVMHS